MEVEYGGIKATGGKLFIIMSLLGTLGGALWGGFELYKRYETMEAKINRYVAPDLSEFDKRLEVITTSVDGVKSALQLEREVVNMEVIALRKTIDTEITALQTIVTDAQETARDIRTDIKSTVNQQLDQIDAIDKRSRADGLETRQAMRNAEKEVRDLIADTSKRWDNKLTKVDSQIEALETKLDKKITKALENPLAAMSKTK
jgi:BMFP domain-containing protein YqiC